MPMPKLPPVEMIVTDKAPRAGFRYAKKTYRAGDRVLIDAKDAYVLGIYGTVRTAPKTVASRDAGDPATGDLARITKPIRTKTNDALSGARHKSIA